MIYPDRAMLKARAKQRVLDESFGVLMLSLCYLLLTDWVSELLNLFFTNPLTAIQQQFSSSMTAVMEQMTASGSAAGLDFSPVYSSVFAYAGSLLSQSGQQALLFLFLLLYLYTIVMSFGFTGCAMRTARGERLSIPALFDPLSMAGKVILLSLLSSFLTAAGLMCFLLPGLWVAYSLRLAPLVLLDHPELSVFQAMSLSLRISRGRRMQLFTLDVSFLGWLLGVYAVQELGYNIGNAVGSDTIGSLLSLALYTVVYAFVLPYREMSFVNFYDAIRPQDLKVEGDGLLNRRSGDGKQR